MNRTLVAGITGVAVAAVGLVALKGGGLFSGHGWPDATVTLSSLGGVCHADVSNDLGGRHGNTITWKVVNVGCPDPQYVSFSQYREYLDLGYGNPDPNVVDTDPYVTPTAVAMPPAGGVTNPSLFGIKIKMKHYSLLNDRRFKYKVCVGTTAATTGNCTDPDLDVWPF